MGKPRIDDIEEAIIAAIQNASTMSYVQDEQVQTFAQRTIDFQNEQLIVNPPAVIVHYLGGRYVPEEVTKHRHSIAERWILVAVALNLRGSEEARLGGVDGETGVYEILEDLKAIFAGLKLTVDTDKNVYCHLVGTTFEGIASDGAFAYGLEIEVGGTTWDNV